MNRKKIVNLISITALVAFIVAVSVISYSIATRNSNGGSEKIDSQISQRGAFADNMIYKSNIDMIIDNSYANETFNIVEILPVGQSSSGLDAYVSSDDFAKYVLNANKSASQTKEMNTALNPNVAYTLLNVNSTTSLSDAAGSSTYQQILDAADLIYLSSPAYTSYTGTSNMSEEIYNWLHTYSLGTYRPIIMDYVTSSSGVTAAARTYSDLVTAISGNYIRYRTFYWDENLEAQQFFNSQGNSYFLKFNVNNNTPTGKVLVIGTGWIQEKMQNYPDVINSAYYGDASKKPSALEYTTLDVANVTAESIAGYDFVILENSIMNTTISDAAYSALKSLSETSKYIIYDKKNIKENTGSVDVSGSNYLKLMDLLISNQGVARYANVMSVSYGFFTSLKDAGDEGLASAKVIADLINSSDYRGSLTSGANGKTYRVLELQPCYPIDLELAAKEGEKVEMKGAITTSELWDKCNYYLNPNQILSGVSEDQVDGETEYYKFELSKAKLVKALGLPYNQITIDQMSTEEFISRKEVVLETYDLVYIGGNVTALTPYTMKSFYSGNYGTLSKYRTYAVTQYLTSFDMYTHTGNISQLFTYPSNTSTNAGDPFGKIDGANVTNVVQNGNDITFDKLNELKAYIDAGMPIIFSNAVSKVYEAVKDKSRMQKLAAHDIDPDSRMYMLLEYAYGKKADANNILWDMDITAENTEDSEHYNENDKFGPSIKSYVHLFNKDTNDAMLNLVEQSETRPALQIVSMPKNYIQGNETTYNVNEDGKMTIKATATPVGGKTSAKMTLQLLIDKDGNGTFDPEGTVEVGGLKDVKELVDTQTYNYSKDATPSPVTLTYEFDYDDFFGLVSWKVVAVEEGSKGACDIAKGYAYYKRKDEVDKKEVNILQIMPMDKVDNPSDNYGESDGHSLYLCTECQMAKYRPKYNLTNNGSIYLNVSGVNASFGRVKNMGLHEHKFGIVKYDTAGPITSDLDTSTSGSEDWDSNFADVLLDDYDFSTTVLFVEELNEYAKIISGNTDAEGNLTTTTEDEEGNAFGNDEDGNPISMTWVDYYTAKADEYYTEWETAKSALEASGTEAALIKYLTNLKTNAPYTVTLGPNSNFQITADRIQQWIDHKAYYMYFMYFGYYTSEEKGEFIDLYSQWVPYHDAVVEAHDNYKKYSCYSYTSDEWLINNYDMVVLGFAEDFGGKDLNVQECQDIKDYLANGGSVLTTHDTTSRYKTSGSHVLTEQLRTTFGIDRFHVVDTEYGTADTYTVTDRIAESIYLRDTQNKRLYGPVTVTNRNLTVDVVLDSDTYKNPIGDLDGKGDCYYVANITEGDLVSPGGTFNITFRLYDSDTDYANGTISSITSGYRFGIARMTQWELTDGTNEWLTSLANGQGTYTGLTLSSTTYTGLLKYPKYITSDADKYYFSELSTIGSEELADRVMWQYGLEHRTSVGNGGRFFGVISPIGITDSVAIFETTSNNSSPYKYVEFNQQSALTWNKGITQSAIGGTSRASQVNTGIVTTYPFTISSELRITGTHTQTYALDLEDSGAAVWYTLAGCEGNKDRSSLFAASPYDGMDAYFLYSYQVGKGTVNYCGAGHTVVTGPKKDNNDERMLYMNVIVNAVRNKGSKPKITIHEKNKPNKNLTADNQDTNPYITEDGEYNYTVYSKDDTPEMDYKVKVNSQTTLAEMYVFYDLNYGITGGDYSNKYTADDNHVLLYHYLSTDYEKDIEAGKLEVYQEDGADAPDPGEPSNPIVGKLKANLYMRTENGEQIDLLKLKPEYFDPYGNYTYLVIWAKDANNKTSYQRIKINLVPNLFDLTYENGTSIPRYQFRLDMIDKQKYKL